MLDRQHERTIAYLVDEAWQPVTRLEDRLVRTRLEELVRVAAGSRHVRANVLRGLVTRERSEVRPGGDALGEGLEFGRGEHLVQQRAPGEQEPQPRLAPGGDVREQAQLLEQPHRQGLGLVDQERDRGEPFIAALDLPHDRQSEFALFAVAVVLAEPVQDRLQQCPTRAELGANEPHHTKRVGQLLGEHLEHHGLAASRRSDHQRRALATDQVLCEPFADRLGGLGREVPRGLWLRGERTAPGGRLRVVGGRVVIVHRGVPRFGRGLHDG